ncbi:E3 ubiquitin ligase [Coemansia biformis]|uniref:E3 ubiquitin ligase n=1 Tax=Coemansia biformis TaxID=1286918 RepID=A0A9W7Y8B9_9FUNG|nr:E3 ubiquitin ligase [Coemansia biformis]
MYDDDDMCSDDGMYSDDGMRSNTGASCNTDSDTDSNTDSSTSSVYEMLDRELQELEEKVSSMEAEMVVQRAEQLVADKRFAQIAEALQCSICLDTLAQPYSLVCGHTFCQECLLQWLAQSKQCPTCRAPVSQQPSAAFAVQDVIRCLGSQDAGSDPPAGSRQLDASPWAHLFPPAGARTRRPGFAVCSVCSRSTLDGGPCVNCAIDGLYRSIANRVGSSHAGAATPARQPQQIRMSQLARRPPHDMLSSVDRLLESARSLGSAFTSPAASRASSVHAAPEQPSLQQPHVRPRAELYARLSAVGFGSRAPLPQQSGRPRRAPSPSPSQSLEPQSSPSLSPPDSLFDPADLVGGRRSGPPVPPAEPDARHALGGIASFMGSADAADESWPSGHYSRRPHGAPGATPPGNASRAEYIMHNGYEPTRRVRVRSPSPRPSPAAAPGSRRAYALHSRNLLNNYMLQLDDGDSTADEADEEAAWGRLAGSSHASGDLPPALPRRLRSLAQSLADARRAWDN